MKTLHSDTEVRVPPFHERIVNYSASAIAARIGCPISTAYDWKAGRRSPPAWLQEIITSIMEGQTN